jgi:transcriptional regulator with XRE-family HTH domain
MQVKNSRQLLQQLDRAITLSGRSLRDIQRAVGVSSATYSQIRKRGGNMTTDTFLALAQEVNLKVKVEK